METQYGIAVTNKYQLFLDDDDADPLELLRQQEEAKEKKKKDQVGNQRDSKSEKLKSAKNRQNKRVAAAQEEQKPKFIEENAPRKEGGGRPARGGFQKREGFRDRGENERSGFQDRDNEGGRDGFRNRGENDRGGFRNRGDNERGARTYRNSNRGEVPPRRERQMNQDVEKSPEFRERNDWPEGERGRGRGGFRRGGRGGRGRGGFDRFGKREFERHSGSDRTSGIKATDKREGGGAHNWGTIQDDLEEQLGNEANRSHENLDTSHTDDAENRDPNTEHDGEIKEGEEVPPDDSMKEMTLDEWKALQKENATKKEFNIRRANEGADESQWKKMHMLKKKETEHEEEEESDDEDYEYELKKKTVNIEITFADNPRRGGRGRRGGGRGRGGRGRGGFDRGEERERAGFGGRGGSRKEAAAPDVANELDFPSLGKASGL